ncbi:DsbA family protein [Sphingomicrobium clamense]|uniref:DsbA family protein n=1 Tax=Sphingomicrobium clamense TaxID=2851013 RepID=A0ABS6V4Q9_9SPHN|nr:DsbA family protein [Sphingomicrobium sp. B8]MBW0144529.1 DsbA family protein [Sphingomicrobium sp. B8]
MSNKVLLAGLGGGLVGALATATVLLAAGPGLIGERLVRDAMTNHPDILVDAAASLEAQRFAPMLEANRSLIEEPFHSSWAGAENPEVTLVEYYDYACGFCRQAKPDLERLLAEDPTLRVVYRELPVLGPASVAAARASLAASKAGKFAEFHESLWASGGISEESLNAALDAAGITVEALDDPAINAEIDRNLEIAGLLGATGTPLFVIGDQVINSADGYAAYKDAIERARKKAQDA